MGYCLKCGNSGTLPNGEPCDCGINIDSLYSDVQCMDIPEQYRNIVFSPYLVKADLGEEYQKYLGKLFDDISSGRFRYKNELICSPAGHSKTVLAYCCMQSMFRAGIKTSELLSVSEITDVDREAEVLFIRVPMSTTQDIYRKIADIVDTRVRSGKSTIFLYNGSYEQLVYDDKLGILKNIIGDGSYGTLRNSTWRRQK